MTNSGPYPQTGKMFTSEEYDRIAHILRKHPQVLVQADDVYYHLPFDGREHLRFANVPGMWDRTFTIYSLGKMFSCTGWRSGFVIGPEKIVSNILLAHENICFTIFRPSQVSFAEAMRIAAKPYESHKTYYDHVAGIFEKNRDWLLSHDQFAFDWKLLKPEGGYFIMADISKVVPSIPKKYFFRSKAQIEGGELPIQQSIDQLQRVDVSPDMALTRYFLDQYKTAILPGHLFYDQEGIKDPRKYQGGNLIRLALCRKDQTMQKFIDTMSAK